MTTASPLWEKTISHKLGQNIKVSEMSEIAKITKYCGINWSKSLQKPKRRFPKRVNRSVEYNIHNIGHSLWWTASITSLILTMDLSSVRNTTADRNYQGIVLGGVDVQGTVLTAFWAGLYSLYMPQGCSGG